MAVVSGRVTFSGAHITFDIGVDTEEGNDSISKPKLTQKSACPGENVALLITKTKQLSVSRYTGSQLGLLTPQRGRYYSSFTDTTAQ